MARGLPASYIKKYGVSKRAWSEYRKVHKRGTTKRKVRRVKTVAKRRYVRRRVTRRRRPKRKISIIGSIGAVGSVFAPAEGRTSMGEWIRQWLSGERPIGQGEDMMHFANDTLAQYTGIDTRQNFPRFSIPWGLVTIVATQLGSRLIAKTGANKVFNNLPAPLNKIKW